MNLFIDICECSDNKYFSLGDFASVCMFSIICISLFKNYSFSKIMIKWHEKIKEKLFCINNEVNYVILECYIVQQAVSPFISCTRCCDSITKLSGY